MDEHYADAPAPSLPAAAVSRQVQRAAERKARKEAARLTREQLRAEVEQGMQGFCLTMGLSTLSAMMEEDADLLCGGPKGKHLGAARQAKRHGYETGSIPLGCIRVEVQRPRVRTLDNRRELPLPTYLAAQHGEVDFAAIKAACVAGVSQREFAPVARALVHPPPDTPLRDLSKSAVGQHFIRATQGQLEILNGRRFDGQRVLALYLDGLEVAGHRVLAALGVLASGEKQILGVREGSSENGPLCRAFLEDLVARGLSAEKGLLVVLDGGKGMASAVRAVFGPRALVQRCRVHKKRNVLEKLPSQARDQVSRRLSELWALPSPANSRRSLESLARELTLAGQKEAGASLREGLPETLTIQHLGLPSEGTLIQSLVTTNALESVFSVHEQIAHRVKNWQHGDMVLRWVAVALLKAEKSFKVMATAAELEQLATALERHANRVRIASKETSSALHALQVA